MKIYKLEIITGNFIFRKNVRAEEFKIIDRTIQFFKDGILIYMSPVSATIIASIEIITI